MHITMSREIRSYLLESYLPSTLFVIMSWGSFVVVPEMVPGRMVLLVTTLLSLVTMFDTVRNNSPNALELKCIEVWLISCTLFVFFALIQYFVVLFSIRYDKHWRHKKKDFDGFSSTNSPATANVISENNATTNNVSLSNHHPPPRPMHHMAQLPPLLHHRNPSSTSRVDNLRLFGTSKVGPQGLTEEAKNDISLIPPKPKPRTTVIIDPHNQTESRPREALTKKKFRMAAEYVIMYAGNSRGHVDQVSLVVFPLSFILFTACYWIIYVTESRARANA